MQGGTLPRWPQHREETDCGLATWVSGPRAGENGEKVLSSVRSLPSTVSLRSIFAPQGISWPALLGGPPSTACRGRGGGRSRVLWHGVSLSPEEGRVLSPTSGHQHNCGLRPAFILVEDQPAVCWGQAMRAVARGRHWATSRGPGESGRSEQFWRKFYIFFI